MGPKPWHSSEKRADGGVPDHASPGKLGKIFENSKKTADDIDVVGTLPENTTLNTYLEKMDAWDTVLGQLAYNKALPDKNGAISVDKKVYTNSNIKIAIPTFTVSAVQSQMTKKAYDSSSAAAGN